ncbi:dipeptidase [Novosphingobium sp.]|uniref:dipeptidase n=1 Tax=Novosphingobium sp. TaxID=1874826 RepID=UPI0025E52B1E|nr:dipeptidase [Novosphingobium sp.]MCC6926586.1 dipeptidase [Novosphingobium sp.]
MRHFAMFAAAASLLAVTTSLPAKPARTPEQVAAAALAAAPVWDGHNDVPEQLRDRRRNILEGFDFTDTLPTADPAKGVAAMQTDLRRLRRGQVGAQFWSVYVSANLNDQQAVQATLEQIDVTRRLVARYSADMMLCLDSACVEAAWKQRKIASLMGMEGGHSIGGSLAVLRQMYALGARYMTLTHFKNTTWADASTDEAKHDGLTAFGKDVVREMQRLGMLVDLSHVSEKTMLDAMAVAGAPVIFSHSQAFALNQHPRNVPDRALDALKANGGIVMVNFYPPYVLEAARQWSAEHDAAETRFKALNRGNPDRARALLAEWDKAHPMPRGSIKDVADHIDYIAKRIGVDHVGLGGDMDGIETTVAGMEDVSTYPALFVELARRGWSQQDLEKLASRNMMRVLKAAEAYAQAHRNDPPIENPTSF